MHSSLDSSPRRLLMVAFQFPPFAGSSAIQRTLRFVQQLPRHGWQPIVLSAHALAYEQTSADLLTQIPSQVPVRRALALDVARHLAWRGRYPGFLARPDRWASWRFDAVRLGKDLIQRYRPAAIWSTYPIPTAHIIGQRLQAFSGLPWIADFRDPMAQDDYPTDRKTWAHFKAIEEAAVRAAHYSVFTTPGAAAMYRQRYADVAAERIQVIENGYDEETFASVQSSGTSGASGMGAPLIPGVLTLLHSGVVYPSERDPTQFFDALATLKRSAAALPAFRVRFRASGNDALLKSMVEQRGLNDWVEFAPSLPYAAALDEMLRADALLVLQAANCNQQIPAKLYEYLRAGRPVIGLTDPLGDTAGALRGAGLDTIAALDQSPAIVDLLTRVLPQIARGQAPLPAPQAVQAAARTARTQELVRLLERATS